MNPTASSGDGIDLLITDVSIIDGANQPRRSGTIAVKDGRIVDRISETESATRVVDGRGLIASPGFIDTHVHSDVDLLWNRQHAATLAQGVTTHIIGQDGLSYAPLSPMNLDRFKRYIAPVNGVPAISWDWSSVAEYRSRFDRTVAVNTAYLVPHSTLRYEVAGMSDGLLDKRALDRMRGLLSEALDEGGLGLSSGLSYFPGSFADTEELVELCHVLKSHELPYVTHTRSVHTHGYVDPTDEAIDIARRTGVKLHISHHRTNAQTVGRVDEVLSKLDDAYAQGVDISLDTYPYVYGSGPLHVGLPAWAFADSLEDTMERLADPALRPALIAGIRSNIAQVGGTLTSVPCQPELEGRELAQIAAERGQSVPDLVCDLLRDNDLDVGFHLGSAAIFEDDALNRQFERDCLEILDRPYAMVGSDGIYVGRYPHERGFGTFPRLLRFAREQNFSLEKLVNRMTAAAGDRFSLEGRGRIEPGARADIVLFDPRTVSDGSTPEWPRRGPEGISAVVVNGEIAVHDGRVTGLFAGEAVPPISRAR